MHKDISK